MEAFTTDTITLSMRNVDTGRPLEANVYHVPGIRNVDGSLRDLSIGQLVMAICLSRATDLEGEVVGKMVEMAQTTSRLEAMTDIQQHLVDNGKDNWNGKTLEIVWDGVPKTFSSMSALVTFLTTPEDEGGVGLKEFSDDYKSEDVVSALSSKMDSLNSMNQTDMISLQSTTSKRDQTYDLITNVLKSLHTVLCGIVNNT